MTENWITAASLWYFYRWMKISLDNSSSSSSSLMFESCLQNIRSSGRVKRSKRNRDSSSSSRNNSCLLPVAHSCHWDTGRMMPPVHPKHQPVCPQSSVAWLLFRISNLVFPESENWDLWDYETWVSWFENLTVTMFHRCSFSHFCAVCHQNIKICFSLFCRAIYNGSCNIGYCRLVPLVYVLCLGWPMDPLSSHGLRGCTSPALIGMELCLSVCLSDAFKYDFCKKALSNFNVTWKVSWNLVWLCGIYNFFVTSSSWFL